jgi:hypothetical protein
VRRSLQSLTDELTIVAETGCWGSAANMLRSPRRIIVLLGRVPVVFDAWLVVVGLVQHHRWWVSIVMEISLSWIKVTIEVKRFSYPRIFVVSRSESWIPDLSSPCFLRFNDIWIDSEQRKPDRLVQNDLSGHDWEETDLFRSTYRGINDQRNLNIIVQWM